MTDVDAAYPNLPDPAGPLDIVAVAGRIGGEVRGLRLEGDLDDATILALRRALFRHKVLFFREQSHLDDEAHQAFAARLGKPVRHPTAPAQHGDFLLELDSHHGGKANTWHTDMTFLTNYPSASILRAVSIPEAGGDTVWANAAEAYARLPQPLQQLADTLRAIHSNDYDYAANQTEADEETDAYHATFVSTVYEAEHPVVRLHPETGERSLLLGSFFKQFVGMSSGDSRRLFETFQSHITRLENTVRWHWRKGDVAIWDNRATQHYAIDDYGTQHRVVRRVTISGDIPLGIDGQKSRQLKPVEFYSALAAE
ncbi:taurine dioxygenase [Sphingomonas oleivorans]|uniref:Taurine dioxygenase n=1 Tax=Sphingomonas oleivorans TaxID=1735121 RepID=A0A2T5G0V2_9SPHN|nr:TauD/TfdA family dioxygenase [Sphingomonas oleivorans]PTQ12741.1 taurine dioxygenase [Sphingomonas oleivorans]